MANKKPTGNLKSKLSLANRIPILLGILLTIAITWYVYMDVHTFEFTLWDDDKYVQENPLLEAGSTQQAIWTTPVAGNYHPLTILSLRWDMARGKGKSSAFHATNRTLHLVNTLLIFLLILHIGASVPAAIFGASLFGVHPMHVESVAWISERKDVLYTLFLILSWLVWRHGIQKKSIALQCFAWLLMLASCLSKGMAIVLPGLLLLDALWIRKDEIKDSVIRLMPFALLSAVFMFVAIWAQGTVGAIRETTDFTWLDKVVFPFYGIWFYLQKMVFPSQLSAIYPYPFRIEGILPAIYYMAVIWVAIIAVTLWYFKKYKHLLFAGIGYLICIAPVLQMLPVGNALTADRYFYVASIPLFVGLALWLNQIYKSSPSSAALPKIVGVLLVILPLLYVHAGKERTKVWKDTITLFSDVVEKYPQAAIAHYNMGIVLNERQEYERAINSFRQAVQARPDYADAWTNLGVALQYRLQYREALDALHQALQYEPDHFEAHNNTGVAFERLGRSDSALIHYRRCLQLDPNRAEIQNNVGYALENLNVLDSALYYYNRALEINPAYTTSMVNKGNTLLKLGYSQDEANIWFGKAADLGHEGAIAYLGRK